MLPINTIIQGDCLETLKTLPDCSIDCCVTSPPYWGLRDYGTAQWEGGDAECEHNPQKPDGGDRSDRSLPLGRGGVYRDICGKCGAIRIDQQLGLEPTPDEYLEKMTAVFREVRRVLKDEGTLWCNMGDSYNGSGGDHKVGGKNDASFQSDIIRGVEAKRIQGLKPKDLCGIPWRLAFALQADGWYLRSDIIWHKPNPMPESVTDRPTKSHEYIFLLSKNAKYYYDADAIMERPLEITRRAATFRNGGDYTGGNSFNNDSKKDKDSHGDGEVGYVRNRRTVWTVPTYPMPEAHFATFPPKLIEPCILAGCPKDVCAECGKARERVREKTGGILSTGGSINNRRNGVTNFGGSDMNCGTFVQHEWRTLGFRPTCSCNAGTKHGVVLDPFMGAGTTALVAKNLNRNYVGCELNPDYIKIAERRLQQEVLPL